MVSKTNVTNCFTAEKKGIMWIIKTTNLLHCVIFPDNILILINTVKSAQNMEYTNQQLDIQVYI